jgi:hypothetical protein
MDIDAAGRRAPSEDTDSEAVVPDEVDDDFLAFWVTRDSSHHRKASPSTGRFAIVDSRCQ